MRAARDLVGKMGMSKLVAYHIGTKSHQLADLTLCMLGPFFAMGIFQNDFFSKEKLSGT